jgi:hypothetical protein
MRKNIIALLSILSFTLAGFDNPKMDWDKSAHSLYPRGKTDSEWRFTEWPHTRSAGCRI